MTLKVKVIPKGYQIVVKSWENDCDNYNTETISGLTFEQVMFYRDIALLIDDAHYDSSEKFGNMYDPSDEKMTKFHDALIKIYNAHLGREVFPRDWTVDWTKRDNIIGAMHELIYEMGLSRGEFYTRMVEEITINLFDEDVYATKIM